jgi:hypothetical protein
MGTDQSENVRMRLLAIARGEDACIANEFPTDFGFELIGVAQMRATRRAQLIRDLTPICD